VPVSRVEIRSRSKLLGTIIVGAPSAERLLPAIGGGLGMPGDILVVSQRGRVLGEPPAFASVAKGGNRVRVNGHSYVEGSVGLPGYSPPVRLVALADEAEAQRSLAVLQRRLVL